MFCASQLSLKVTLCRIIDKQYTCNTNLKFVIKNDELFYELKFELKTEKLGRDQQL